MSLDAPAVTSSVGKPRDLTISDVSRSGFLARWRPPSDQRNIRYRYAEIIELFEREWTGFKTLPNCPFKKLFLPFRPTLVSKYLVKFSRDAFQVHLGCHELAHNSSGFRVRDILGGIKKC